MRDAILEATGMDIRAYPDAEALAQAMRERGHHPEPNSSRGKLIESLFSAHVEPNLIAPTFITDYPVEISPLAKKRDDDPTTGERFEYFVGGMEMGGKSSYCQQPTLRLRLDNGEVTVVTVDEETDIREISAP